MAAKRSGRGARKVRRSKAGFEVRAGGTRVEVSNSGLEVWLYDDANREAIATAGPPEEGSGGMPPAFAKSARKGLIVGYSMQGDGGVDVEVHVGAPFTAGELAVGRWLEPQQAFLRLPSGHLCIESNDASRVGPEEPGAKGAVVKVPPGDYRLTLLRVDHEALDREQLEWKGPQELVLLTPGGKPKDAASDLLPFRLRRDTTWVGKHRVTKGKAEALAWFNDYWDTFFVNLDARALEQLGLKEGGHFRTHVPAAGITLISVYGPSWEKARRLPKPSNVPLDEYGYAALSRPQDWGQNEALFCRRDTTKTRVEDPHQNRWLPATVEVLDSATHPPLKPSTEIVPIELHEKSFFDDGFLAVVLSDLLPGVDDLDALPMADALARLETVLAKMDLAAVGDIGWTRDDGLGPEEVGVRLYAGADDCFASVIAGEGKFEFVFLTELEDGTWVVTGLADELERRLQRKGRDGKPVPTAAVRLSNVDEPVAKIRAAHRKSVGKARALPAPGDFGGAVVPFVRFLEKVFG